MEAEILTERGQGGESRMTLADTSPSPSPSPSHHVQQEEATQVLKHGRYVCALRGVGGRGGVDSAGGGLRTVLIRSTQVLEHGR